MSELSWLESLNTEQKKAVTHKGDPLLILAGAGSGKTRVVTTRIAYLIEKLGFSPYSILAVTFTNKAAAEMKERVEKLVPQGSGAVIKTFHSFGAWLLRRNGEVLGLKPHFTIYDDEDTIGLLKTLFPELPRNEIKALSRSISKAKDDCLSPEDNLQHISADPDFPKQYLAYEKRLREIGNADFGDLIYLSYRLLIENPEIQTRIQQRFQVILVDEYQDSNRAQFKLLQALVAPHTWLCVVGDDDQSIYRFRGADIDNILSFQNQFKNTHLIKLEENYRSTGHILAVASQVVSNNKGRLGKQLWTRQEEGVKPIYALLDNQQAEAEYVAKVLQDNQLQGSAILYRTNAQSRVFEQVFRSKNIPYKLVGTLSFYGREEVKDVLSYLSFINNSADEIAFRRIVNKPTRGIGAVSVKRILTGEGEFLVHSDLMRALELSLMNLKGKALKGASKLYSTLSELIKALSLYDNLGLFIKDLIIKTGLLEHYQNHDKLEHTQKVSNLEELVSAGTDYPASIEGLSEFLELIELDQSAFEEEQHDQNRVTLITMHNTKGLEFDRVFITGLEEGLFPRGNVYDDEEEIEEERRLFYVSITRARKELYLLSCKRRMLYGRTEKGRISRFVHELPEEHINKPLGLNKDSTSLKSYKRGCKVYHTDYGLGYVAKTMQNGGHQVVFVEFETGEMMTFLPEFTQQLTIMD